jgi:hypothetical protein
MASAQEGLKPVARVSAEDFSFLSLYDSGIMLVNEDSRT